MNISELVAQNVTSFHVTPSRYSNSELLLPDIFSVKIFKTVFFFLFLVERLKDSYACYNLFCFDSMDVLKKCLLALILPL